MLIRKCELYQTSDNHFQNMSTKSLCKVTPKMTSVFHRMSIFILAMGVFFYAMPLEAAQKKSGKSKKSGISLVKKKSSPGKSKGGKKKKPFSSSPSSVSPSDSNGSSSENTTSTMVYVEGGTLPAGSELAGQTVANFKIGKYEVTWGEWKEVRDWAVNNNKGYDLAGAGDTTPSGSEDNFPVGNVNWYYVVKWCNAKSEKEGWTPVYTVNGTTYKTGEFAPTVNATANGYRLPSEKEWEWAARGGVSSQGYTYSGSNTLSEVAWTHEYSSSGSKAVGTKLANELGIYDMSGNMWEWCEDVANTTYRRVRGGGWLGDHAGAAVAFRGYVHPERRYDISGMGFRLARNTDMVTVTGGTLPSGSVLAGQVVADFEIGKYEVTWGEWKEVRAYAIANGYDLTGVGNGTATAHPVQQVSWYDVVKWSNAKSEMKGLTAVYTVNGTTYKTGEVAPTVNATANGYRLPSEKEWEWAARGGVQTHGYTYSGSNVSNDVAWAIENSSGETKEVGTKGSNELGIYDMSGNVWEWCFLDLYGLRHIRGGSWNPNDVHAAVADRGYNGVYPDYQGHVIGFRLARSSGN